MTPETILIGKADDAVVLLSRYANRHGLIAGATGTGKTVTLQGLAESFSERGVPVFLADVKGDLSGLCQPGALTPKLATRAREVGLENFAPRAFPCVFWDVFGEKGHPVRTTISEFGPFLLGRLLRSTRLRKVCSMPPLPSPTIRASCCSTSRICGRCWRSSARMRPHFRQLTETSHLLQSVRSCAGS